MDHAVAPAHDQRLDAVGHALVGEVERLVGVAALEAADGEPGPPQPLRGRWSRTRPPLPLPAVGFVRSAISRVGTRADYRAVSRLARTAGSAQSLPVVPHRGSGAARSAASSVDPEPHGVRAGGGADRPGEATDGGRARCRRRAANRARRAPPVRRRRPGAPRRTATPGAPGRGPHRRRPARGRRRRSRAGRTAGASTPCAVSAPSTRWPAQMPRSEVQVTSRSPSQSGRSNGSSSSYDGGSCGPGVTAARPGRPPTGRCGSGCALPCRGSGRGSGR